jgi:hypothetical protein
MWHRFPGIILIATAATLQAAGVAGFLPEQPSGIGRKATDRDWWGAFSETPEGTRAIRAAENAAKTPMPAFDRERYLDFTTNGDRTRYQKLNSQRWGRFGTLVLGECLEHKGRFIGAIRESVTSLCGDPSWILPAHDRGAGVFKGADPYIDLAVASNAYQMALAAWWLEDSLPKETVVMMRENIARRLTNPILGTIQGTASAGVAAGHWWAKADHNWNAVCTAGAVGAILATEPSRETRGKVVEWAVSNMDRFLSGFGKDGYCSEGMGYWNYGFGHYVVLSEILRAQTGGKVDLYQKPSVRKIASAPARLEISAGVYPAFADCALDAKPDRHLVEMITWRLDGKPVSGVAGGTLYQTACGWSARRESGVSSGKEPAVPPPHSWFEDSGVCVVRPTEPGGMAAAWKGGHNAEHHNHNDVGSTIVVWKGRPVIADPGSMVYRAETFSKDRYRLPVMSSYGHSVPVVGGFLQSEGAKCRGKVLNTTFTPASDSMTMDLSSAYPGSGVTRLERVWIYQRESAGLSITDSFAFKEPSSFATALLGFGDWYLLDQQQDRAASFLIDGGGGAVLKVAVEFSAPGGWKVERVPNPGKPAPCRLGLSLKNPVGEGRIRMRVEPYESKLMGSRLPVTDLAEKLPDPGTAP